MLDQDDRDAAENPPGEPGAEGGASEDKDTLPGAPSDNDDTAAGDTDQHSSADA